MAELTQLWYATVAALAVCMGAFSECMVVLTSHLRSRVNILEPVRIHLKYFSSELKFARVAPSYESGMMEPIP